GRQPRARTGDPKHSRGSQVLQTRPGGGGQADPPPCLAAASSRAGGDRERRRIRADVRRQQHPGQQPKDADPRQSTRECQAPGQIAEPEHLAHRAPVNRQDEWCEGNPGQPTNIKRRETQDQKETGENREGGSSQSSQSPQSSQSKFNRVDRQGRLGRPGRLDYSSLPWHFLYFFPLPHQHGSLRPIFRRSAAGSIVAACRGVPPPAALATAAGSRAGRTPGITAGRRGPVPDGTGRGASEAPGSTWSRRSTCTVSS